MIKENPSLKPLYYAFLPDRVTLSVLKSIPLSFAYKVMDDMEEFDISKRETQEEIVENCKRLIIRDMCVSTMERVVEHTIVSRGDPAFTHKMFKNVRESSLRKEERMGHSEAALSMFFTGIRVSFVYHVSVFLVEEAYLLCAWLRQRNGKKELRLLEGKSNKKKSSSESFGKKSLRNLIICVLAIVSEGIGASLGTYLYPGSGALVGSRVCGTVAYLL